MRAGSVLKRCNRLQPTCCILELILCTARSDDRRKCLNVIFRCTLPPRVAFLSKSPKRPDFPEGYRAFVVGSMFSVPFISSAVQRCHLKQGSLRACPRARGEQGGGAWIFPRHPWVVLHRDMYGDAGRGSRWARSASTNALDACADKSRCCRRVYVLAFQGVINIPPGANDFSVSRVSTTHHRGLHVSRAHTYDESSDKHSLPRSHELPAQLLSHL